MSAAIQATDCGANLTIPLPIFLIIGTGYPPC